MSRENVEMIEGLLARAQDDPAELWEMVDDDARWEVGDIDPLEAGSDWHGPEGIREFFRRCVGAFDDWGYEVLETIDAGDSVVVHIRQWGRGKGSGALVETASGRCGRSAPAGSSGAPTTSRRTRRWRPRRRGATCSGPGRSWTRSGGATRRS